MKQKQITKVYSHYQMVIFLSYSILQELTNMKYTEEHLLCSGSIKYTEIYGYYEIQCPLNVSTCIKQPDKSLSTYVNNGTQCGLYRSYKDCESNCSSKCLYHEDNNRIRMKQTVFIPSITTQYQYRYTPTWYYYCPAYIDWKQVGFKYSILLFAVFGTIIFLIILIELILLCKKDIPAYLIIPYKEKEIDQYVSNDVYGVKERKRKAYEEEHQKNKNKKSK